MSDRDECDPIRVAGDDGHILDIERAVPAGAQVDRSADGSITSVITPEGEWLLHVDPSTELGAKIHRIADAHSESPEELIHEATEEFIEEQRERR